MEYAKQTRFIISFLNNEAYHTNHIKDTLKLMAQKLPKRTTIKHANHQIKTNNYNLQQNAINHIKHNTNNTYIIHTYSKLNKDQINKLTNNKNINYLKSNKHNQTKKPYTYKLKGHHQTLTTNKRTKPIQYNIQKVTQ